MMTTNCLGPYLFTKLLTPLLKSTASNSSPNSVRVAWAASIIADAFSPQNGIEFDDDNNVKHAELLEYGQTKAGNFFLANSFGIKNPEIVSVVRIKLDVNFIRKYLNKFELLND